ncbi:hypothetical protein [Micrococcus endophyticus]|uniref:hypothetical protein n=1 Tax=Micrococcus endophyticus TaxID=455343 RepID=UPI0034CD29E8
MSDRRPCAHCADPLPEDASPRQRYCTHACRSAAYRARTAGQAPDPAVLALTAQLDAERAQRRDAETRIGQLEARVRRKTEQVQQLAGQLAAERRSAAVAIAGQANRTVAVRADNAALAGQLSALRRSWSVATAGTDLTPDEVAALRGQLSALRARYEGLSVRHRRLSAAAEAAATERAQLQGIVRQWDTLCRRLAKAVAGQPVAAVDKRILATHARFRSAVATGDRTTPKEARP